MNIEQLSLYRYLVNQTLADDKQIPDLTANQLLIALKPYEAKLKQLVEKHNQIDEPKVKK